ncbi:MAG: bacteriohemerythrin [Sulfurimonadaceae bacterium]|jgi:hemerythrin
MLLDKDAMPLVAMDFMNATHYEDVMIINKLYDALEAYEKEQNEANAKSVEALYAEWFEHTIGHFQAEEVMMREKNFPPYPMHKGEHDRALHEMDEVFRHWNKTHDALALKNYLTRSLAPWLLHHIQTMDTVTASFFKTGLSPCSAH